MNVRHGHGDGTATRHSDEWLLFLFLANKGRHNCDLQLTTYNAAAKFSPSLATNDVLGDNGSQRLSPFLSRELFACSRRLRSSADGTFMCFLGENFVTDRHMKFKRTNIQISNFFSNAKVNKTMYCNRLNFLKERT